ncbi:NADH-quinone oxidoreductase subunit J [Priestia koreensis]|uniref:NADH-quinone oxidoreductase subunit J n=1 Tax=Priestia koreensis TaxID=284581 RepID=UPI001F56431B|nr:NADH-quinone oxidoreductase subunit J [Priestia koreensis]MCM3004656.1 NADH-quinone oxidoreductase subunit J [Priestia koreensis]UNL84866.1 NADH-quinone oxidoreductase subunit J [Priestia koreensis]
MWSGEYIAFLALATIAISGGILMLNLTKVIHMLLSLVFTFLSIAGLYVLLSAEFIAAVQVLIYSGAVTIIMLFGIMLTKHNDQTLELTGGWRRFGVFLGVLAFGLIMFMGIKNLSPAVQNVALENENTKQIGLALYSKFIIPFELTSIVLLVALIGAIILAKRDEDEVDNHE